MCDKRVFLVDGDETDAMRREYYCDTAHFPTDLFPILVLNWSKLRHSYYLAQSRRVRLFGSVLFNGAKHAIIQLSCPSLSSQATLATLYSALLL